MGSSSSKSMITQTNNTFTMNQSSLNLLNQQINTTINNTTLSIVQQCSASAIGNQSVNINGNKNVGGINLGNVTQEQTVSLNFSCAQTATATATVASAISNTVASQLQNNVTTSILSALNAKAASSAETQFGALGGTKSNAEVTQITNNTTLNTNNQNIQNVINTAVQNNFNQSIFSACLASVSASQNVNASGNTFQQGTGITAANISQTQGITVLSNCVQNASIASNITGQITSALGVQINNTASTTAESTSAATAEATALSGGIFQGLASIVSAIGNSIGSLLGLGALGASAPISISSCLSFCCCCCIILLCVISMFAGGHGSSAPSGTPLSAHDATGALSIPDVHSSSSLNFKHLGKYAKKIPKIGKIAGQVADHIGGMNKCYKLKI